MVTGTHPLVEVFESDRPPAPLLLTVPHSGEVVPPEAGWLQSLSSRLLLTDVDRFVDKLYAPAREELRLPAVMTQVHRYAVDLNRFPEDVDLDSVVGALAPSGTHPKGFHWVRTTRGEQIMSGPISPELHRALVIRYHDEFHRLVESQISRIRSGFPGQMIHHLDCHSMPSTGTGAHRDQGQKRADVVISDLEGKSASKKFVDQLIGLFRAEGFQVAYNWPYLGGRITQRYGQPQEKVQTVQIELNRSLYMNEETKEPHSGFKLLQEKLKRILGNLIPMTLE